MVIVRYWEGAEKIFRKEKRKKKSRFFNSTRLGVWLKWGEVNFQGPRRTKLSRNWVQDTSKCIRFPLTFHVGSNVKQIVRKWGRSHLTFQLTRWKDRSAFYWSECHSGSLWAWIELLSRIHWFLLKRGKHFFFFIEQTLRSDSFIDGISWEYFNSKSQYRSFGKCWVLFRDNLPGWVRVLYKIYFGKQLPF